MSNIEQITGSGVPLLLDDIDTDRIIPARYLRCVTFDGLGEYAFEDDRQQDPDHPFDNASFQNGSILVAGSNFGCGSSREHAPQSLMRWGIRGVIAESFAEIFFGNCTALGIPAVCLQRNELEHIAATIIENPELELQIDLRANEVRCAEKVYTFSMPPEARSALITGEYDFMAQLLDREPAVREKVAAIPYLNHFE